MESLVTFIENKLRLKVNQEKSAVAKPADRHFLGVTLRIDAISEEVTINLSERSKERIAKRIKELTPRNWGQSFEDCILKLNRYLVGWIGFFRICTKSEARRFAGYDAHIRRRLRLLKLKQWKRRRAIVKALIALGVSAKVAWRRIYQGKKSLWKLSHDYAVDKGLSNAYFAKLGLQSLLGQWEDYQQNQTVSVRTG